MTSANSESIYHEVVPRDLHFDLTKENVSKHWFNDDPWDTMWLTAILAVVPVGERWVMRSAAMLLDKIQDPAVRQSGVDFCKQERVHAREHNVMNEILIEKGLPLDKFENNFVVVIDLLKKYLSPEMQGALAAGGEHFTAIIASVFLEHPEVFKDTDPEIVNMLYWHFIEETEHKAVSFDVFTHASGKGLTAYLRRVVGMASMTAVGFPALAFGLGYLLKHDGELSNMGSARRAADTLFGKSGIMRRFGKLYLPFYLPNFHPWDDDNRDVANAWQSAYEETGDPAEAYKALCEWVKNNNPKKPKKVSNAKIKDFFPPKLKLVKRGVERFSTV